MYMLGRVLSSTKLTVHHRNNVCSRSFSETFWFTDFALLEVAFLGNGGGLDANMALNIIVQVIGPELTVRGEALQVCLLWHRSLGQAVHRGQMNDA
jgi:hypothetical protein